MSTSTIWKINQLHRELADGYVFSASYTVDSTDGTYNAGAYGSVDFDKPDTLIPFKDLTETQVIGWVKEKLGGADKVKEIEDALQAKLDEQKTPKTATGNPW